MFQTAPLSRQKSRELPIFVHLAIIYTCISLVASLASHIAHAQEERNKTPLTFQPNIAGFVIHFPWFAPRAIDKEESYKIVRLNEMATEWKGTKLEPMTKPLLAMLLLENGALSEKVRGDHGYAIGLEQNHICLRGFNGKHYCGKGAESRLAKDLSGTEWDGYLTDWRVQFKHYTVTLLGMVNDGYSADAIIHSWNSRQVGRLEKVKERETLVAEALSANL